MELPDPFLPGAVSLLDQLDKRMMVMLRDGKTLIGYLRTIDQFANLVLHETIERIHVDNCYGDIPRGIFLIRGENVVLAGEIDENRPNTLKQVSDSFTYDSLNNMVLRIVVTVVINILEDFKCCLGNV